jgi:hypothetical protein
MAETLDFRLYPHSGSTAETNMKLTQSRQIRSKTITGYKPFQPKLEHLIFFNNFCTVLNIGYFKNGKSV